jgi:hypothetical protein
MKILYVIIRLGVSRNSSLNAYRTILCRYETADGPILGQIYRAEGHKEPHTNLYQCLTLQSPLVKYLAGFTLLYVPPGLSFNNSTFLSFQYFVFCWDLRNKDKNFPG